MGNSIRQMTSSKINFHFFRGPVKYVALGILNRSDPRELWQVYNVKRRIPHPEYKPPSKYHDIALLETDTE